MNLDDIRKQIDTIDHQLLDLLSQRADLVHEVGVVKKRDGLQIYAPEREQALLNRLIEMNQGRLPEKSIRAIYREIMSAALALEDHLRIAYLGPEGTWTHQAAIKKFGNSVDYLPQANFADVFDQVARRKASYGVVPIENSTEGTVNHTLDMFLTSPLKICGEVELRINHHLLGTMRGLEQIRRVAAHPQALAQCRAWLKEYLPAVELIGTSSNAEGARRARDEDGTAAIAGDAAAEVYGLRKVVTDIEDRPDNTTRFLIIGRELLPPSGSDKTSILLSTREADGAGALYKLLAPLAKNNVNMSRIESRPSRRRKWDYVFFLDVDGHVTDKPLAAALKVLAGTAPLCRVLGSYPRAVA